MYFDCHCHTVNSDGQQTVADMCQAAYEKGMPGLTITDHCDMNFYHTGEGNKPLEVFQKFFYPEILGNQNNWLRSVASASCPAYADYNGLAHGNRGASDSIGAVGLIIFH